MLAFRSLALLAVATVVAGQALDPSLGDCAIACYNNVKAQSGSWPTPCPADEMTCICKAPQFKDGVHDCSAQCPGGVDFAGTVMADLNKICDVAVPPAHVVETTIAPSVQAPGATSVQSDFMVPAPTASASTSQAPTSQSPGTSTAPETLAAIPSATGAASTSTSSEETATAKPTETTITTTSTSGAESTSSSSPEATHSNGPVGLTTAAMAGIGIGATAAVIALAALAFWFVVQRRNKRPDGFSSKNMVRISDPAPGGGRSFAGDQHYETGLSELEMKSRRYEDMIPRQQPRHMV